MRVRHKVHTDIVREVNVDKLGQWIDANPPCPNMTIELDQLWYEHFPKEETWRDVSTDVRIMRDQVLSHDGYDIAQFVGTHSYRFRRIIVTHYTGRTETYKDYREAFIIERKTP